MYHRDFEKYEREIMRRSFRMIVAGYVAVAICIIVFGALFVWIAHEIIKAIAA